MISAIFRIVIGLIFGAACAMALSPALAAFDSADSSASPIATLIVILFVALLAFFAPTIRRAFGRGFLLLGVSCFVLPLSALLLSGRVGHDMVSASAASDQGATALGAGLAGMAFTGIAGFLGFILGSVFIIIGLVLALGGRREVIVVQR